MKPQKINAIQLVFMWFIITITEQLSDPKYVSNVYEKLLNPLNRFVCFPSKRLQHLFHQARALHASPGTRQPALCESRKTEMRNLWQILKLLIGSNDRLIRAAPLVDWKATATTARRELVWTKLETNPEVVWHSFVTEKANRVCFPGWRRQVT